MRVLKTRLHALRIPFQRPYLTALGTVSFREVLLVDLEFENGVRGVGEASLLPGDERRFGQVLAAGKRLALDLMAGDRGAIDPGAGSPRLTRRGELTADEKWPLLPRGASNDAEVAALAGFDLALWDGSARSRGVRAADLLDAEPRESVEVNALIGGGTVDETVAQALRAREDGFETVKLKVGMAPSLDEERRRVGAVRDAIGPGVRLRLDANGAWSEREAIETITGLEEFRIEFIEQPVPPGDIAALKRVAEAVSIAIAADESVADVASAREIMAARAAGIIVIKPIKLGGITPSVRLVEMARAAGVRVAVTTSIDSGIGVAAALQIAAVLPPGAPAAGLATGALLASDLTLSSPTIERGRMQLPAGPGLGVDIDSKAFERYCTETWQAG